MNNNDTTKTTETVTAKPAAEIGRRAYGFEIKKEFYEKAKNIMLSTFQPTFNF